MRQPHALAIILLAMTSASFSASPPHRSVQPTRSASPNVLGVCGEYAANATHSVEPILDAEYYFRKFRKGPRVVDVKNQVRSDIVIDITVETPPSHGTLAPSHPDNADFTRYDFHYKPDKEYVGEDSFELNVWTKGTSLTIRYEVKVFPADENPNYVGFCNWEKARWKISAIDTSLTNSYDLPPNPPVNTDRLQAALAGSLRGFAAPAAGELARWASQFPTSKLLAFGADRGGIGRINQRVASFVKNKSRGALEC